MLPNTCLMLAPRPCNQKSQLGVTAVTWFLWTSGLLDIFNESFEEKYNWASILKYNTHVISKKYKHAPETLSNINMSFSQQKSSAILALQTVQSKSTINFNIISAMLQIQHNRGLEKGKENQDKYRKESHVMDE